MNFGENTFIQEGTLKGRDFEELLKYCRDRDLKEVTVRWSGESTSYDAINSWIDKFNKKGIRIVLLP